MLLKTYKPLLPLTAWHTCSVCCFMLGSSAFAVALKQTQHKQISTRTYIKQIIQNHSFSFRYTVYALSLWCRTTAILKLRLSLIMQLISSGAICRKILPCIKNECIQKLAKLLLNAVWKHWDEKQEARWLRYNSHAATWMHTHTRVAGVWHFQGFHRAFVRFSPPSPLQPYRQKIKPFPQGNHWSLCYLRALIITGGVNKWVDAKIQLGLVFKYAVALTVLQPVTVFLHYICDGAEVKPFQ